MGGKFKRTMRKYLQEKAEQRKAEVEQKMSQEYKLDISNKAKLALFENGGDIVNQYYIKWPTGTETISSVSHGGWGNFSYEERMLPDGRCIGWDSDTRVYTLVAIRDPLTKEKKDKTARSITIV